MLEPDPPSSLDYAFNTNPNEALEAAVISSRYDFMQMFKCCSRGPSGCWVKSQIAFEGRNQAE